MSNHTQFLSDLFQLFLDLRQLSMDFSSLTR